MSDDVTVSIYIATTPEQAMASEAHDRWDSCPAAALPLPGDMVAVRDESPPYVVTQRVWAGPCAVAVLVRPRTDEEIRGMSEDRTRPVIIKVLDLSTRHLPQEILDDLNGYDGVIAEAHLYGAWLWVPEDPTAHAAGYPDPAESSAGVPAEVLTIQLYARAAGCDWVRLDADGDSNPDLPHWEW